MSNNTFDVDAANNGLDEFNLVKIPIVVKYHPGKPDEQKVPVDLWQVGNLVERRENGWPKVSANGHFDLAALLLGVENLVEQTGVFHVLDCLNHGLDLRLRARTRPADADSQTAQRSNTRGWISESEDAADYVLPYIKSEQANRKTANLFLDKVYEDHKDAILELANSSTS